MKAAIATASELPDTLGEEARYRLRVRQLDQILGHSAIAAVLATIFAAVIAAFFAPTVGAGLAQAWFAAKAASAAPRLLVAVGYKQNRVREILRKRPWLLYSTILLDGAIWGLAGLASAHAPADAASALVACLAVVATVATLGLQVQLLATALFVTPILGLTIAGLLLRFDGLGLFASVGLSLLIIQLWASAFATGKRLVREFLSRERLSHTLQLQSETAERLEMTSEQLRREGAVKSMFLGTMSHEFRTPLHGILGITAMMKRDRLDPVSLSRLAIVQAQGEHLLALIGALLDVSRIETGRLELHTAPFDLAIEIRQLAELYRERTAATAVAFVLEAQLPATCWVAGDAARVRQILHNLLGNAVKFTKEGWIRLQITRGQHGETVCNVIDTGPGISAGDQGRIFEAFAQTAAVATQPDVGTGLGLTISRELAHAMGGELTVESIVGVGSKFQLKVMLPAVDAPASDDDSQARAANSSVAPHSFSGYRVLLAEDNDVNALIADAALRQLGAEVLRVGSGREAVAAATGRQRPHAILMDLRMPDLDGLAATREIRAREQAAQISRVPVIALTANSSRDDINACEAAGMDGFLSKPFTDEALIRVLAAHLGPGIPFLADENDDSGGGYEAQPWDGRSGAVH
ncbi:MAG TPA: ATP-binding protein [Caldimonas sp.]|nr:ATP-binding protein [Caldimonas sp.]HEX4235178.1 ATP-binding protein [Caldimonas sp.]